MYNNNLLQRKMHAAIFICSYRVQRWNSGGAWWWGNFPAPYFLEWIVFLCNYFEELQTVLFKVELIINNAPLTYVYPNTIETCLIPNHLLFDRQLLYFSNTTSTVVTNLTMGGCRNFEKGGVEDYWRRRPHHGCGRKGRKFWKLDPLDWLKMHLCSVTLNYLSLQKFVNISMK